MVRWQKVALLVLPKRWLCVSEQNQMCHLCGLVKIVFKKCVSVKKIKHEAFGWRVGKKSDIKFFCRPVVSIIVCQFNGCCVVRYAYITMIVCAVRVANEGGENSANYVLLLCEVFIHYSNKLCRRRPHILVLASLHNLGGRHYDHGNYRCNILLGSHFF